MLLAAGGVPLPQVNAALVVVTVPVVKFEFVAVPPSMRASQVGGITKAVGCVTVRTGFAPTVPEPTVIVHCWFLESPEQVATDGELPHCPAPEPAGVDQLAGVCVIPVIEAEPNTGGMARIGRTVNQNPAQSLVLPSVPAEVVAPAVGTI